MEKINRASDLWKRFESSQQFSKILNNVLVVAMMFTLGVGLMHFGARIAPGWRGGYVAWMTALIAVEAIITRSRTQALETRQRFFFHFSEWIAFGVALKLIQILWRGSDSLLAELQGWQTDFGNHFITGDYLVILIFLGAVWLISRSYAGEFESFYEREQDAEWDEIGKVQNTLREFRNRISSRIFLIGIFIVLLAVLARIDMDFLRQFAGYRPPSYTVPVGGVLLYFLLSLIMLSQTQYALLRALWLSQRLPIQPALAAGWMRTSAWFFLLLAVVVFFLPTEYSVGLFDSLRFLLELIMRMTGILLALLLLPLNFCMLIFRFQQDQSPVELPPVATPPPPAEVPLPALPWWEMVRALIFWGIFLALVIFAVRYYIVQNKQLMSALRRIPILRWVGTFLANVWHWLRGANRRIQETIQQSIARLRPRSPSRVMETVRRRFRSAPNSPREKVIHFYLNLISLAGEKGLHRRPAETPSQYQRVLHEALPEIQEDLQGLTETFLEARYSAHVMDQPEALRAETAWQRIQQRLVSFRKSIGG